VSTALGNEKSVETPSYVIFTNVLGFATVEECISNTVDASPPLSIS